MIYLRPNVVPSKTPSFPLKSINWKRRSLIINERKLFIIKSINVSREESEFLFSMLLLLKSSCCYFQCHDLWCIVILSMVAESLCKITVSF